MPGSSLLFDTNAFIAWSFKDLSISRRAAPYSDLALTLISLGELIFGALKSSRPNENRENLRERLLEFRLIAPDRSTAEIYGEVSLKLRRKGRPIPDNDIWIASIALQHDLSFLTRDSHFREVDGLNLLEW